MIPTDHDGGVEAPQTVVVGVKMDALSRELLTWSLVKVAQPGDVVLALHVLAPNEIFDTDGKSSLLSLVKAFDSVLGVYEGFCNLKQVDLKLKICRGSSVRKIIVREANLCAANKVIVGTAVKHHTIRSSTSVAKYCAKKLPKDCSVLAVRNGKVVFQREATASAAGKRKDSKGANDQHNSILEGLQRSSTINSILNNEDAAISPKTRCDEVHDGINADLEQTRLKIDALHPEMVTTQTCCICSHSFSSDSSLPFTSLTEERGGNIINHQEDNSKALVPFQKSEAASSSVSLVVKELPELRPGWPLLRRRLLAAREGSTSSSRDISVVQWATSLPSRHCMSTVSSSTEKNREEHDADSCDHGVHSNAMVPFNSEIQSHTLDEDSKSALRELKGLHERYSTTCRSFKYEELQSATSNFMPENLIGKGGSSWVYRGTLSDGKELAVKILKPSEDVLQEFMMEIEIITSLHHKNIISLFGFCFEDSNLLLVYDLLSRGSLEENLHGDKKDPAAFGCNQRFKVALGVAEALYYLHNKNTQQIIHRDVKSSNILLSEDFEPKLSDFGFAKWASTSSHITCTDVAGTFGYLAPEYFMYGKVTDKIDVFAFGVVLLELLSGRKPISNELPKGEESLVMWARPILNGGKVSKLLDPCLSSNNNRDQIERMVLAATLCIRRAPRARPHMRVILKLLQGDLNTVKWARSQVNASDNIDKLDEDGLPQIDLQSHLSLALLDVEDDSLSMSSLEQHVSLEDYLQGRWSRSSSLD